MIATELYKIIRSFRAEINEAQVGLMYYKKLQYIAKSMLYGQYLRIPLHPLPVSYMVTVTNKDVVKSGPKQ
jgi:hypothetical protein